MDKVQLQMSRAKNMRTEEMRWSKGKKREVKKEKKKEEEEEKGEAQGTQAPFERWVRCGCCRHHSGCSGCCWGEPGADCCGGVAQGSPGLCSSSGNCWGFMPRKGLLNSTPWGNTPGPAP